MIKNIKIQNYKLFKDFSVNNLSQIVLIGGQNNSGKTSFLEAVFLPLDYRNPGMFMKHFNWRGVDALSLSTQSLFAPAYHNFDLNKNMVFEYMIQSKKIKMEYQFSESDKSYFTVGKNNIELSKEQPASSVKMTIIFYENGEKKDEMYLELKNNGIELQNPNNTLIEPAYSIAFVSSLISRPTTEQAHQYSELDRLKNTEGILDALKIIEPKLRSLNVVSFGNNSAIYGDIGLEQKVHLSLMGQGIRQLLSILLMIKLEKDGAVLIDELENGFHHSVLPLVWKAITSMAKSNNTQIIATTHSYELLKATVAGIPKELKQDFQYMRIDRKENEFKTKQYRFENLEIALENELEVR